MNTKHPDSRKFKRFARCILHIGTEKTGSSALQRFLELNRRSFRRDGVIYPDLGHGGSQWEFVAAAHHAPWLDAGLSRHFCIDDHATQEQFRSQLLGDLARQFALAPRCNTLLISSEHFHSRLKACKDIARLRDILDQWADQFSVVVFFRRQDRVAVSFNSTRMKSGAESITFKFPKSSESLPQYYRYDNIFEAWGKVFGKDNVAARIYSEHARTNGCLIRDFCSACGLSHHDKQLPAIVNASISLTGLQLLEKLNSFADAENAALESAERRILVEYISRYYPGKHYPMTSSEARRFMAMFEKTNARLRDLAFPERESELFDDDFSEYPDHVDQSPLNVDEVLSFAINSWREARQERWRTPISKLADRIRRRLQ